MTPTLNTSTCHSPSPSSSSSSSNRFRHLNPSRKQRTATLSSPSPNLMSESPKTPFLLRASNQSFSSEANRIPTSSAKNHPSSAEINGRKPHWIHENFTGIGLGIIDALNNCKSDQTSLTSSNRMIVFGSKVKVQAPPMESDCDSSTSPIEFHHSVVEFGMKKKESQISLSRREMELLEEYTCVISHGPNPKKTHIFDNCVVVNCDYDFSGWKKENRVFTDYPSEDFLSCCHACKKTLSCRDIFMYRGEIAFCSDECRQQGMISDEELRNSFKSF